MRVADKSTKQSYWNSHHRNDDEDPFPSRKTTLSSQCLQQSCLNPPTSHAAYMAKHAENGSPDTKLGFFIPRAENELGSHTVHHVSSVDSKKASSLSRVGILLGNGREPSLDRIQRITCHARVILYVMRVKTLQVTFAATKTYLGRTIVKRLVPGI